MAGPAVGWSFPESLLKRSQRPGTHHCPAVQLQLHKPLAARPPSPCRASFGFSTQAGEAGAGSLLLTNNCVPEARPCGLTSDVWCAGARWASSDLGSPGGPGGVGPSQTAALLNYRLLNLTGSLDCSSMAFVDSGFLGERGLYHYCRKMGRDLSHSMCF